MKIAILSCFYPYRGGISQFNACVLQELEKSHTVKAFNFRRQYPDILFPGKTQYVTKDDNAVPVESQALLDTANPFSYIATARAIREWNPDLLIMRYWMSWFAPSLGYIARHMKKGCKVISILDNVVPHEPHFFDRPFTKYFLKPQDGFVVLCNAVRQDLLNIMPDARHICTPHPLYSHFGEKMQREEAEKAVGIKNGNTKNILFFGLIREYKGLDLLIEAFGKLDKSYRLIVAGEPYGSFEKYQKLIDASPNKENIILNTNYIEDSQVSKYFSSADVCVLPYRSATQSGISSISYHFEVPMITTDVGGLRETIGERGTGVIMENGEPATIARAIEDYFAPENAGMRGEMIHNIRKEKERLSWGTFCSKLEDFYKTL
ncbi:MAG: glycosyltransferase [Bacteroidales bacterium]|nr:glycosyltransferase [Bacteroidales bacterium]